ncbi:transporter, major facilitator subfamily protein [Pelomyxa schiedti]|nr:transporter, major facilitator subfamily protein [Pelomyxa schiedti]
MPATSSEDPEMGSVSSHEVVVGGNPTPSCSCKGIMGSVFRGVVDSILPPGVPRAKLLTVLMFMINEGLVGTSIAAYIPEMVLDLGVTDDPDKVGYYAGFITSSFFLCQFLSSFPLGWISDRKGRRPVMLIGAFGSFLSTIMFGFSWSYPAALAARSLNGLLNGNIGVSKTYLGELTDATNRIQTFALLGLMYGLGAIGGSTLGGLTARPATKLPSVFSPDGLFGKFPYLLPNLIVSVFIIASFVLAVLFIKENPPRQQLNIQDETPLTSSGKDEGSLALDIEANGFKQSCEPESIVNDTTATTSCGEAVINNLQSEVEMLPVEKSEGALVGKVNDPAVKRDFTSLWKKWALPLFICFLYAYVGFVQSGMDTLFPVWASATPESGGLGFDSTEIGIAISVGGLSMVITQLFFYKRIANRLKLLWTNRFGSLGIAPVVFALPFCSLLVPINTAAVWTAIISYLLIYQFFRQCVISAVVTLLTNSVGDKDMGTANGIGQSLVALTRGFSPAIFPPLLAWSFSNTVFPIDYHFPFVLLACLSAVTALLTCWVPTTVNLPFVSRPNKV